MKIKLDENLPVRLAGALAQTLVLKCPISLQVGDPEMGKLEVIEHEVATLSAAELNQFRDWFAQFDNALWDRQFDEDAAAGKLDNLGLMGQGQCR